jgi:hypothetical protein
MCFLQIREPGGVKLFMLKKILTHEIEGAFSMLFDNSSIDSIGKINKLTPLDIKKAYRKKVKIFHPDRAKITNMDEKKLSDIFKKLTNAYNILLNFKKLKTNLIYKNFAKKENFYGDFKPSKDFLYTGLIPDRRLRFAEYLFYSKVISWQTLIKAIINQYQLRPRLGKICIDLNYISDFELNNIIKENKYVEKFGETALKMSYLTKEELQHAIEVQKKYNRPIGKYFVEVKILTEAELLEYFLKFKKHNLKFKNNFINNSRH